MSAPSHHKRCQIVLQAFNTSSFFGEVMRNESTARGGLRDHEAQGR